MRKEVKERMDKLREQMQWLPSSLGESTFNDIALILAAKNGQLACVKHLVAQGADIHNTDDCAMTAFIWSATNGHLDCLKYLVAQGADIHNTDDCAETPFIWSAKNGHLDCLMFLVQQGANIHAKNDNGSTALLLSAYSGHLDCLEYLHQQGADIQASNTKGNTALHLSAEEGYVDLSSISCNKVLISMPKINMEALLYNTPKNGRTRMQSTIYQTFLTIKHKDNVVDIDQVYCTPVTFLVSLG